MFNTKPVQNLERETGIEPATNSLEGCDSTTELLPRNPAVSVPPSAFCTCGADDVVCTDDHSVTKGVLYQLTYIGANTVPVVGRWSLGNRLSESASPFECITA